MLKCMFFFAFSSYSTAVSAKYGGIVVSGAACHGPVHSVADPGMEL